MNSRGQAALEYLMTYGWALIVIAIVVGVLVFIVATPTGSVACNSNQPGKVNVVSNNLGTTTGIGTIAITNLTGGAMTSVSVIPTGLFAGATYKIDLNATDWALPTGAGLGIGDHTLEISAVATTGTTGTFPIGYTDPAGLTQSVTITCQNLAVT